MSASSMNCIALPEAVEAGPRRPGRSPRPAPPLPEAFLRASGRGGRLRRNDVDGGPVADALLILHFALDDGIDGEVAAHQHAAARMHLGADLADEDVARNDFLPAEDLDAAVLPGGVAAVAGRALPFFVCHGCPRSLRRRCR